MKREQLNVTIPMCAHHANVSARLTLFVRVRDALVVVRQNPNPAILT